MTSKVKMLEQIEMWYSKVAEAKRNGTYDQLMKGEDTQMAMKKKMMKKGVKKAVKKSAPVKEENTKEKTSTVPPGHKPVVIHLPIKLHGAVKITAQATGTNVSGVVRTLLRDWVTENKKKAIEFINAESEIDEDEEEVEDEDNEGEDEDVEDEDESEDEEEEEEEEEDED